MVSVLLVAAASASAQAPVGPGKGESVLTMRVDGELSIDPEGRVINGQDMLAEVKAFSTGSFGWYLNGKTTILVDGKAAIATSPMRITLAAEEMAQGYRVTVDNVVFRPNTTQQYEAEQASKKAHPRMSVAGEAPAPLVWITSKRLQPPKYPSELQRVGVEGMVLLNLRLNPDGTVAEVFAAQSSLLNVKGGSSLLDRARTMLERNASAAAKRWTFDVASEGQSPLSAEALTVSVPVDYMLGSPGAGPEGLTGTWRHEFRGPNLAAPWLPADHASRVGVSDLNGNEMLAGVSPFELSDKSVIGKSL